MPCSSATCHAWPPPTKTLKPRPPPLDSSVSFGHVFAFGSWFQPTQSVGEIIRS